ncbi:copper ABC transporter ATP-binding protein [Hahella sp. CCB-MM4]|uniref:ABC transporter ATP-binding protein n=1 Tax=Hahella sp. (strain CCB-MM4) TaxID=1926491 RepID=UPI000B9B0BB6|nr:ABC transporter ATP-binding protein [Hahella sp. CCB-MM4]OZG71354.1 copper ABC transporter ATP-binding protein [Hahella sp. CCB-MM4]
MLHLKNVTKCLEAASNKLKQPTVNNLSLNLAKGEILGLFGHNGAGKTTTIKMILGILPVDSGDIQVLGYSPRHVQVRRSVGYLPENVMFYPQLTGRETLNYFARLKQTDSHQVEQLLQQVGLSDAASRKVKTYSKGMRQRLGLAQALLGQPQLLLLDEPTVGLDPIATAELYALIEQLRQTGTSVILCSHVLPGVESLLDRAAIMSRGQLLATGTLSELRHHANLPVRIRIQGISSEDSWFGRWREIVSIPHQISDRVAEITISPEHKMVILKALMAHPHITDVDLRLPGLEDIYQYFMTGGTTAPDSQRDQNPVRVSQARLSSTENVA